MYRKKNYASKLPWPAGQNKQTSGNCPKAARIFTSFSMPKVVCRGLGRNHRAWTLPDRGRGSLKKSSSLFQHGSLLICVCYFTGRDAKLQRATSSAPVVQYGASVKRTCNC